jgi:hypothetical protein
MAKHETSLSLPPRWADDSLSAFIDQAFRNTLATFVHKRSETELLIEIDESFMKIGSNLLNPSDVIGALLLLRSHSAFRAACRLAMSGQISDALPSMRACLEYALYALHINSNPPQGELWIRRHDDDASLRAVRREFTYSNVIKTLRLRNAALCSTIEVLYERTIDFGGHPNERAVTGSMTMSRADDRIEMQQIYLHGDSLLLDHGLKTTAQVGLGSLCIFGYLFKERFEILRVQPVIDELKAKL